MDLKESDFTAPPKSVQNSLLYSLKRGENTYYLVKGGGRFKIFSDGKRVLLHFLSGGGYIKTPTGDISFAGGGKKEVTTDEFDIIGEINFIYYRV